MVKKITVLAHLLTHKLLSSIKRFPEAVSFAVATVALLILMNHWQVSKETMDLLTRMAMTLAFGFPIALSLKVFGEQAIWLLSLSLIFLNVNISNYTCSRSCLCISK